MINEIENGLPRNLLNELDNQTFDTPFIYNDSIDTTNITNVMLIDSSVSSSDIFYNSVGQT